MTLSNLAMYAALNQTLLQTRRNDREKAQELDTLHGSQKGSHGATQKLVPPVYLRELTYIRKASRAAHDMLTIPTDIKGLRILPTTLFEKHAEAMNYWSGKQKLAFRQLEDSWDSIVENVVPAFIGRELRTGELPDSHELHQYFSMEITYRQIPDNYKDWRLEGITPDDADYLRRYAENETMYMWEEAMKEVYHKAYAVIENFVEVVGKPDGAGLKRETTMENLRDFAEVMKGMNIWQDASLDEAYSKMKEFVDLSIADLRQDEALRETVTKKSETIKDLLAKYR